jgi:NADH-quinone oxidoreductase subunit N
MLLSLAGIPLTLGFIGKFYAVAAGVNAGLWIPVAALVAGSVISLYYYLRIIVAMLSTQAARTAAPGQRLPWSSGAVLALLTVALFGLGVYPAPLVAVIRASAADLAGRSGAFTPVRPAAAPAAVRSLRR